METGSEPAETAAAQSNGGRGCPLCGGDEGRASWQGAVLFGGARYQYVSCTSCESAFCRPLPSMETISKMYGGAYGISEEESQDDPKDPQWVLEWLKRLGSGVFLDFGCGKGTLLSLAQDAGWKAVGIELDEAVARQTEASSGAQVFTSLAALPSKVDVVHMGDVVEHLTDPLAQVAGVLEHLRPGGTFLAQGPLEAGPNLFTLGLRSMRRIRPAGAIEMAPYHLLQATVVGQRRFFARLPIEELEYLVSEESWPAPRRLQWSDWRNVRRVALFSLSAMSRAVSHLRPRQLGNRYRYAGHK